ncbi:MAG TPA: helix-turn-helix transcriptional regulator [Fervidobacterium sp.]|nr:helix-turn-helix transcriptional regulator [Fervidobacterium sp.]
MDIKMKIYRLMEERNWTSYILAEKANLPQSTLATLFSSKYQPSLQTLEKICAALGISLSDLFADETIEDEGKVLAARINSLPEKRRNLAKAIVEEFESK